ncbi:MAG: molybdopterin-guanine dinucleotide biosynthesis protein B [Candidatus Cloacimonadaceae bacterium]|nr:molybdopterin-guanine dinucleotide biosynthesis protein B [Candidatus Cloacimonadaceae bacterium]
MKAVSVIGYHHTGKTTTVVALIKALCERGYTVSSIKDIHSENYSADKPGSNSDLHARAGAASVFANGLDSSALVFPHRQTLNAMKQHFTTDFLVIEGMKTAPTPKILCAENEAQIDELMDDTVIAISGMIAGRLTEYRGLPVICLATALPQLLDIVITKAFPLLPDVEKECCGECGFDCFTLAGRIVQGLSKRQDCVLDSGTSLCLTIDGKPIEIVPFIQRLLTDQIRSFVGNLKEVDANGSIEISIKPKI